MKYSILGVAVLLLLSAAAYSQPAQNKPFSINGQVVDHDDKPVAGATVQAYLQSFRASDGRFPITTTGDDGRFTVGVPRGGTYTMTYGKPATGFISTYNRFYYSGNEFRPEVVVDEDRHAPSITLRLPEKPGMITGKVIEADSDKPVSKTEVKLCRSEAPKYCYTVMSGSKLSLPVIAGAFSILVSSDGFEDWFQVISAGVAAGASKEFDISLARLLPNGREIKAGRLPAPEIVFPLNGAELFGFPRVTKLQWLPVPEAASYTVDIEVCEGGKPKEAGCTNGIPLQLPTFAPTSGIEATSYEFTFIGNQPGRWRIWAVDAEGRPGTKTPWMTFFYPQ